MKRLLTICALLSLIGLASAQTAKSVVPLADPFILLDGDTYYAYGTNDPDGIAVWTSTDLLAWRRLGQLALHRQNTTETQWFWAPEVYHKNGRYYMYYSANEHLYVATADRPEGPFRQVGGRMMENTLGDEKCIDSSVYFDDDGQAYCFFVRFTDGNCIWSIELDDDLVTPRPATLHKCISVEQPWENLLGRVNEGPFILKHNNIYYLTYSGNDYRSQDYAVGYAQARNIASTAWTKSADNPIVRRVEDLVGCGHHSFFTDKEGRLRIVFHAHDSATDVAPRRLYIGTMEFSGNKLRMTDEPVIRPVLAAGDDQHVYLRGNIAGDGFELSRTDDQTWGATVTLDDSRVFLFSDKYVYFECPEQNYRSQNIRINGGTYDVSLRLADGHWSFTAPEDPWRISAFGSSVCNGQGATGNKGYAYLYGEQLRQRYADGVTENPFYVSGISIGGNTTQMLLDRYDEMTRDHSRYVVVGLSMGNEGIHEATDKQRVLNQFSQNLQTIVRQIRQDGKVPVVMNNYTRGDFTADDYTYIKKMNLQIHEWDVASVNTLGAIDDGAGHWASGYMQDNAHPTTNGHREFLYAMPPSLFDALAAGKPQPERDQSQSMTLGDGATLCWAVEGTVHPFTVSLRFRGADAGRLLRFQLTAAARQGSVDIDDEGHLVYTNPAGRKITTASVVTPGQWHTVTLTHYYAQGRTLLYLDEEAAEAEVRERLSSISQVWAGDSDRPSLSRDVSELFFWRSAFTPEEVAAHCQGRLLKSSLEIYVPCRSAVDLVNRAQSLNGVVYVPLSSASISTPSFNPSPAAPVYNLGGRRLASSSRRGIHVRGGRLVAE
ncbi:MAG: family 43 glycosylhydrolase [Prevotella sp.]|nr:family 43 glycosylhydrolase [Prevotella sp.]